MLCLPVYTAYEKLGNRTVVDYDVIILILNRILELDGTTTLPHIRTIRSVVREQKTLLQELGIGEEQIRSAVKKDKIKSLQIGNRFYITTGFIGSCGFNNGGADAIIVQMRRSASASKIQVLSLRPTKGDS